MLIRQYQGRARLLGDTRPLRIFVEDIFVVPLDPATFTTTFSLYLADDRTTIINHAAAPDPSDVTSRVEPCTFQTLHSFFLQYDFLPADVVLPGEYYWQFHLTVGADVLHIPATQDQVITWWNHGT